ncbi:MAG: hypothetical protein E6Q97_07720 [Desulfurellales bacterium]|nr:MAG: hypothetical protein E6Q97_07720 [Desulfurellales bacterium]
MNESVEKLLLYIGRPDKQLKVWRLEFFAVKYISFEQADKLKHLRSEVLVGFDDAIAMLLEK